MQHPTGTATSASSNQQTVNTLGAERRSIRSPWVATIASLVFVIVLWGAVGQGLGNDTLLFEHWHPTALDWLFYGSIIIFGWHVVIPTITSPNGRAQIRQLLCSDPVAFACTVYLIVVVIAGTIGYAFLPYFRPTIGASVQPPSFAWTSLETADACVGRVRGTRCFGSLVHPFGTDHVGRSLLIGLIEGAHVAIQVAAVVSVIAVPLSVVAGAVSGYIGGAIDTILMRTIDVIGTVPAFLVYLIVAFVYGRSLLLFVVVFGLLSWGGIARLVRSEVIQLREEGYVAAALATGSGPYGVFRRHLVPNLTGVVCTAFSGTIAWILLVEASLAFLGLNAGAVDSWGTAIANGFQLQSDFRATWWVTTIPMLALMGTIGSFAVLGDRLRDVADPQTVLH